MTGTLKTFSISVNIEVGKDADEDLINLSLLLDIIFEFLDALSSIACSIVGTPVNHVGECFSNDLKKLNALNFGKITIFPPKLKVLK